LLEQENYTKKWALFMSKILIDIESQLVKNVQSINRLYKFVFVDREIGTLKQI